MRVRFKTNIDLYRNVSWPVLENLIPRVGEFIHVHPGSKSYCESKQIPTRLEVVAVTYHSDQVLVELHYNDLDYKLYKQSGSTLF